MKNKFIRFLKDNHAFDEYKQEILPYTLEDLNAQLLDGGAEFLLNDGCIFFWGQACTGIDWKELSEKWTLSLASGQEITHAYEIEVNLTKFYVAGYDFKAKEAVDTLLPLVDEDGEEDSAFFYRVFNSKDDARKCFYFICSFYTASEIEVKIKKVLLLKDAHIGSETLASFMMRDEEYSDDDLQKFLSGVDWEVSVPLLLNKDGYKSLLSEIKKEKDTA